MHTVLRTAAFVLMCVALSLPAEAKDRVYLGRASLSTNDAIGDFQDRWQSASASQSIFFGPADLSSPEARLPGTFGALIEYRAGYQVITPANTQTPAPGDRPVVGAARSGFFTHLQKGWAEVALGAGVEAMGPATRVTALQDIYHETLGFDRVAPAVLGAQMGNRIRPMLSAEAAMRLPLDEALTLRPYVEAHTGLETYGRVGADLLIGVKQGGGFAARDYVTGHLYTSARPSGPRVSMMLGADAAFVAQSSFLPADMTAERLRTRLRAGMTIEDNFFALTYGLTYLGREFEGQDSGQMVGSWSVKLRF